MDNVFIERLWRSLKYECVYLNAFETSSEALVAGLATTTRIDPTRPSAAGRPTRPMLRRQTRRNFKIADDLLAGRDFFFDHFTAPDAHFYWCQRRARQFEIDLSGFRNCVAHFERMQKRSMFKSCWRSRNRCRTTSPERPDRSAVIELLSLLKRRVPLASKCHQGCSPPPTSRSSEPFAMWQFAGGKAPLRVKFGLRAMSASSPLSTRSRTSW